MSWTPSGGGPRLRATRPTCSTPTTSLTASKPYSPRTSWRTPSRTCWKAGSDPEGRPGPLRRGLGRRLVCAGFCGGFCLGLGTPEHLAELLHLVLQGLQPLLDEG